MAEMRSAIERPTIPLVGELCAALSGERVRYCHFKSNAYLDRSRTGENDLDLLIARADETRFLAVIHRLGFKLALRPEAPPGILDYYGLDPDVGRVVHVHAHYQLIVGDDLTKNYRIPLEGPFLDTAREDGEFLVPAPELEYILLVIRLVLKHSTWDAFLLRLAKMPGSARVELDYLLSRIDEARVNSLREQFLPFVDSRTFDQCRRALVPGASSGTRIRAGARLTAALRPCARRPRRADIGRKLRRRGAGIGRRLIARPPRRKRLASGGATIAIVGADGAGKSTAVEGLARRLGKSFAASSAHLGKPPPSLTTSILRNASRARSAALKLSSGIRRGPAPSRATERAVLATALARDRYRAFRRIRRIVADGDLVVCDRFPLPELTLMDGPRVERVIDPDRRGRLTSKLAALEQRYYRAITRPELVIVLRLDPEIAVTRRPEDAPDFLRARWDEIWAVDWEATGAHVVDAGQPQEWVLSRLEELVWSEL